MVEILGGEGKRSGTPICRWIRPERRKLEGQWKKKVDD